MSYYLSPPLQLFMEWQNMRYSQEFKDNVVARLLSKELSISEAVEQYSIGKSTISYWLRIAREQAVCGTLPNKGNLKPMTKEERMRLESIRDEDIDYSDVAPSNPEEWKDAVRANSAVRKIKAIQRNKSREAVPEFAFKKDHPRPAVWPH